MERALLVESRQDSQQLEARVQPPLDPLHRDEKLLHSAQGEELGLQRDEDLIEVIRSTVATNLTTTNATLEQLFTSIGPARYPGIVGLSYVERVPESSLGTFEKQVTSDRWVETVRGVRGHSYRSVEMALALMAQGTVDLDAMLTHTFGLDDVDRALRLVGGEISDNAIHVSITPWNGRTP